MKKMLISLVLISLLVTSAVMVAVAQEPMVEPTEEPTVEVTEEPTVEPTEEPTVEPTEEPTVEPTEEPTVEPTEEPTVEPTEEPTVEPTEEPTVEPTEEPTVEPTEEPTVEPTATLTPTVEPTATLTPTVAAAADVGAQAIAGQWTSYVVAQNLGNETATVILELYQPDGSSGGTVTRTLPISGSSLMMAPSAGVFAGVLSSANPVAVSNINTNNTGRVGDVYPGISTPTISQTLPLVFRDHAYNKSKFYIQNATGSAQDIVVEAYIQGSSTPSATVTYNDVPANSNVSVDFMDSDYDGFGQGAEHYGYAIVTGQSGNVAVVHETTKDTGDPNTTFQTLYDGMRASDAAQDLYTSMAFNGHAGWNSGIMVVNMGSAATTVEVTYYSNMGVGSGGPAVPIAAKAVGLVWLPNYTPTNAYGAVKLHSTNANSPILAIVNNTNNTARLGAGSAIPAVSADSATDKIAFPVVYQTLWETSLLVFHLDPCSDLRAGWYRSDSDPTLFGNHFESSPLSPSANDVTFYYGPGFLPEGLIGAAFLECTTGGRMLAVANTPCSYWKIGTQMPGYNY